ncbi:hypothetical protein K7432_014794 [Basidiobolus ranarum]|uniref:Uncharacterized protein n=1 Tax=Basidiobolus ranarum TaxID=34480 RepID=A0ABR2VNY9_9FUNG
MMGFSLEKDVEHFDNLYTLNLSKMQRMLRSFRSKLNAIINDAKSSPSAFAAYVTEQSSQKHKHTVRVTYGKKNGKSMSVATSAKGGSFESTIMKHEASLLEAYRHLLVKLWLVPTKQAQEQKPKVPTLGMFASQALGKHLGGEKNHEKIEKYYEIIPGHFRRHVLVAHLVQECKRHVRSYNFYRTLLEICVEHKLNLQVGELLDYLMEIRPLGLQQDFHYFYNAAAKSYCVPRMISKLKQIMSAEQFLRSGFTDYVTKLSSPYQAIELLTIAWKALIKETTKRKPIIKDPLVQIRIGQWTSAIVAKFMSIQDDQTVSPVQTERCVSLIAQLSDTLAEVRIQQFSSCSLSLNLVLLNSTFIHNLSRHERNSKHWVKRIQKLFLGNEIVDLDVVILSYKTHQNLLALARTCQTFGLYSVGVEIINGSLARYSEIRQESDLSSCPTVRELTIFVRELERRSISNEDISSKLFHDVTFDSWASSPASRSLAYGLSCPSQSENLIRGNKRKLLSANETGLKKRLKYNVSESKRKMGYKDLGDDEYSPCITKKVKTKATPRERKPLRDITSSNPVRPRRQTAGQGVRQFWVVPLEQHSVENDGWSRYPTHPTEGPLVSTPLRTDSVIRESQLNVKRVRALPPTEIDELCI